MSGPGTAAASTPCGSNPGTPASRAGTWEPHAFIAACWYCKTAVHADAQGLAPKGTQHVGQPKMKCAECSCVSAKLGRLRIGLDHFSGLEEVERAAFFKNASSLRGNKEQLKAHVAETMKRTRAEIEEKGEVTVPRPLKFYTDLGYDGKWIEDNYKDGDKEVSESLGTKCYAIPLSYLKECFRDKLQRGQEHSVQPVEGGREIPGPKSKKGELPARGSDRVDWTGDQESAWSNYLVKTARDSLTQLTDVGLKPEWANVPETTRQQHAAMVSKWNYVINSQRGMTSWYHSHEQLDGYNAEHKQVLLQIKTIQKCMAKVQAKVLPPPASPAQAQGAGAGLPAKKARKG